MEPAPVKPHPKDRRKMNIQKIKEKNETGKGMVLHYQVIT